MKKILMFTYSILAYGIAFGSIMYWILSVSNLIPEISIDQPARLPIAIALINNVFLIALFGVQHSIMARKTFKDWIKSILPEPIERSTYVLISGILLAILVGFWQPLGGTIWSIKEGTILFNTIYALFFAGWGILFISSFLINHFDLFGVRQTFLALQGKEYEPLEFKLRSFYKHVRHPLYSGMLLGMWATPQMTVTHLGFALAITSYVLVGIYYEEKDLIRDFGKEYLSYQAITPKLVPFTKSTTLSRKRTAGGRIAASK